MKSRSQIGGIVLFLLLSGFRGDLAWASAWQLSAQPLSEIEPRDEPNRLQTTRFLVAVAALFALTVANSGVLAYLLFQRSRGRSQPQLSPSQPQLSPELLKSIGLRLTKLESSQGQTDVLKAELGKRWAGLEGEIAERTHFVEERIHEQYREVGSLMQRVKFLADQVQGLSVMKGTPVEAPSILPWERDVLIEAWKRFRDSKEHLAALESALTDGEWRAIRDSLLFGLPQVIPEDLRAAFDAMLAPVRGFHTLVTKLSLIPRLVNGDLPTLESEAQEALRIRELMALLIMTQNSGTLADQLNFSLRGWLENDFVGFADRFLQRLQQARLEGESGLFEKGYELILQALRHADLAPIDLFLGMTVFDSRLHTEVSPARFPNLPDGVVVAVVRNGFMRGNGEVVSQAEVIVNRADERGEEA